VDIYRKLVPLYQRFRKLSNKKKNKKMASVSAGEEECGLFGRNFRLLPVFVPAVFYFSSPW
jgi:hypothetical protein